MVSGRLSVAEPAPVSVAPYTGYNPESLINQPPVPADKKIEPYIASASFGTEQRNTAQTAVTASPRRRSLRRRSANPTIAGVEDTFFSLSSPTTSSRNSNPGSRCTRNSSSSGLVTAVVTAQTRNSLKPVVAELRLRALLHQALGSEPQ
jgi:hypothetical protein